jgi:hypothetical protein
MAGCPAPRLAINQLTVPRKKCVILGLLGNSFEIAAQAKLREDLDCVWAEIDAPADRFEFRHGIKELDLPAKTGGVQRERESKPADASADDDDIALF